MSERPGEETPDDSVIARAFGTSALGNSTAFGFSIAITASFGMLSVEHGTPRAAEVFAFAVAAALAVALIEGLVTHGFRQRVQESAPEVAMLGTALNVLSVTAALAVTLGVAGLIGGVPGWGLAAGLAAATYVIAESFEVFIAEHVQALRGDPDAADADGGDRESRGRGDDGEGNGRPQ